VQRFQEFKDGFATLLADPRLLPKVLIGGFLLINPFLVILLPLLAVPHPPVWVKTALMVALVFNVLSFWFPLGFTYEVLRRAASGKGRQLPDWEISKLPRFAREGSVKLVIAIGTLLLPAGIWLGLCHLVFIELCRLPISLLGMLAQPILLFAIPFCAVGCCRWLDGHSILSCAFNYGENWRLFRKAAPDYLIASAFLVGVNAVTTAFFYSIPFAAVFGLCLVDMWFGPIYASTVRQDAPASAETVLSPEVLD
jgi:hypothetical protein